MPKTGQSAADRVAYKVNKLERDDRKIRDLSPMSESKADLQRRQMARQRVTFGDMLGESLKETHSAIKARKK